jgi:hypothetical protein
MPKTPNKYLALQQFIDSIICNSPGIKIFEYEDKLTVKNNKSEYVYTIQTRFFNSRNREYQEEWSEDFKKLHDITKNGQMHILHGCKYSNLKRRSQLISFSSVFPSFDAKKFIPGSTIKIGYMNDLCVIHVISSALPTEKFMSNKIYPIVGLCQDASCSPRFLRCVYENEKIIDDLEKLYTGGPKFTHVIDRPLEDQLEEPESFSNKLEDPIKLPSVK